MDYFRENSENGRFKPGYTPRFISLGHDDTYCCITEAGGGSWSKALQTYYPPLYESIHSWVAANGGSEPFKHIEVGLPCTSSPFPSAPIIDQHQNIFLNPHEDVYYFCIENNGDVSGRVDPAYSAKWATIRDTIVREERVVSSPPGFSQCASAVPSSSDKYKHAAKKVGPLIGAFIEEVAKELLATEVESIMDSSSSVFAC
jgi:hypothetical protein